MVKKLRKSIERSLRNRGARNSVKLVILAILLLYSCKRAQAGRRSPMKYGIWFFTGKYGGYGWLSAIGHWINDNTLRYVIHVRLRTNNVVCGRLRAKRYMRLTART